MTQDQIIKRLELIEHQADVLKISASELRKKLVSVSSPVTQKGKKIQEMLNQATVRRLATQNKKKAS